MGEMGGTECSCCVLSLARSGKHSEALLSLTGLLLFAVLHSATTSVYW